MTSDDTFELYDLEVTVEGDEKDFVRYCPPRNAPPPRTTG